MNQLAENYLNYLEEQELTVPYVTGLASIAYKQYKDRLEKAPRACAAYKGSLRSECLNVFKLKESQNLLRKLQSISRNCAKVKSERVDKCREKMEAKMTKVEERISTLEGRLRVIKQKMARK